MCFFLLWGWGWNRKKRFKQITCQKWSHPSSRSTRSSLFEILSPGLACDQRHCYRCHLVAPKVDPGVIKHNNLPTTHWKPDWRLPQISELGSSSSSKHYGFSDCTSPIYQIGAPKGWLSQQIHCKKDRFSTLLDLGLQLEFHSLAITAFQRPAGFFHQKTQGIDISSTYWFMNGYYILNPARPFPYLFIAGGGIKGVKVWRCT